MALVSLLFSFLAKKIGSIVQAVFGWSVTALFGRLPGNKQLAVSIALLLSIAWPVFVVGLFFPAVAGWALAFLPLEAWVGPLVMRIVWGALALTAPLLVGGLVHWAAPSKKGSLVRTLLNGYPLALGFFVAFVLTVVTVPLVKLATILRGLADTHVYVQPRIGRYDAVVRELAEACVRAGLTPEISDLPTSMALSTKALKVLAAGAVSPIVAEQVRRVRAEGVELYLYPSDLLIRGKAEKVALVRAMISRTDLDKDAYLVTSERAQCIQDELMRLLDVVTAHERRHEKVGQMAGRRLVEIWNEMNEAKLPFEEWVLLESIARGVERRIASEHYGHDVMILDGEDDALTKMEEEEENKPMATESVPSSIDSEIVDEDDLSTRALVMDALDEAKQLVRIEVELAKAEAMQELEQVKRAAIGFGISLAATVLVLCLLAMALVLALGGTPVAALGVAGGFMVLGGAGAFIGYSFLPKAPLEKTRRRLQTDVNQLKEHIA